MEYMNPKKTKIDGDVNVLCCFCGDVSEPNSAYLCLACLRSQVHIFKSFCLNALVKANLSVVLKKFYDLYIPITNVTFERYFFFTRKQSES